MQKQALVEGLEVNILPPPHLLPLIKQQASHAYSCLLFFDPMNLVFLVIQLHNVNRRCFKPSLAYSLVGKTLFWKVGGGFWAWELEQEALPTAQSWLPNIWRRQISDTTPSTQHFLLLGLLTCTSGSQ